MNVYISQRNGIRHTSLMRKVEKKIGMPISDYIWTRINETGMSQIDLADELGISKATLAYWCRGFGIDIRPIALREGERAIVVDADNNIVGSNNLTHNHRDRANLSLEDSDATSGNTRD